MHNYTEGSKNSRDAFLHSTVQLWTCFEQKCVHKEKQYLLFFVLCDCQQLMEISQLHKKSNYSKRQQKKVFISINPTVSLSVFVPVCMPPACWKLMTGWTAVEAVSSRFSNLLAQTHNRLASSRIGSSAHPSSTWEKEGFSGSFRVTFRGFLWVATDKSWQVSETK